MIGDRPRLLQASVEDLLKSSIDGRDRGGANCYSETAQIVSLYTGSP